MKKVLSVLFISLSLVGFAQETLTEGVMNSKMTMSSSNEQVNAQYGMVGDILSVTYFKDNFTRSETSNVMVGNSVSIYNTSTQEMLVYMDSPMLGKMYVKDSYVPTEEDLKDITIEKTDETKEILGYSCVKYIGTATKEGVEVKFEIYSTEKISAISGQVSAFGSEFKGFPLYMKTVANQQGIDIIIVVEVTDIRSESVSSDIFDMTPPEGYKQTDKLMGM